MTTFIAVRYLHYHSGHVVKRGKTARGTQRYLCHNRECAADSFLVDDRNRGWLPEVKQLIIDMSLNANRVRDTARSLHMSTDTVLSELKKKEPLLESVNTARLSTLNPDEVTVDIERAGEAEMDERCNGLISTIRTLPGKNWSEPGRASQRSPYPELDGLLRRFPAKNLPVSLVYGLRLDAEPISGAVRLT